MHLRSSDDFAKSLTFSTSITSCTRGGPYYIPEGLRTLKTKVRHFTGSYL